MAQKTVQTIADIARLAGVSKSTVSRALNGSPLIGEPTKEKILGIARQHNFQLNQPAQRLSRQESRTIALAMASYCKLKGFSVADLFTLEIMNAISAALAAEHYDLLLAMVDPHDTRWPQQYLSGGRADGFILIAPGYQTAPIKALLELRAPFIVWGNPRPGANYCSVIGDNVAGGRLATEHLLQSGRRRIAFLGGPEAEYEVQQRYAGYAAALAAAGLTPDPALVSYGQFSVNSGAAQMSELLERDVPVDAVFANSDLMAIAAMNVLRDAGRQIPEDVAVVGYDDLSITEISTPGLTTIRQNLPLAGKLLVQNLLQYIHTGVVTNVQIPAELVIRETA